MSWNRDTHRQAHVDRAHRRDVDDTLVDLNGIYTATRYPHYLEVDAVGEAGILCCMCEYVTCICRPFQGLLTPEPSAIVGDGWKLDIEDLQPIVDDDLLRAVSGALLDVETRDGIAAFYAVLATAKAEQLYRNADRGIAA